MARASAGATGLVLALVCGAAFSAGQATGSRTLEDMVKDAAADLQRVRRGTLKSLPPVQVVTPEVYVEEYVVKTFNLTWGGDFERSLDLFKALGMLPTNLETNRFLRKYGTVMTSASYDFFAKRILFPRRDVTRDVLLHELVHAMQDERYDIRRLMTGGRFELDRTLAVGALIEGEATNVQLRCRLGASRLLTGVTPYGTVRREAREQFETIRRHLIRMLPDVPENLIRTQAFVYDEGVLFVERLRRRGRHWAAVDAAYRMPPRSTTQIMHPEKYIEGEWPVEIEIENKEKLLPGYQLVTENTLGEFGTRLFLMTHLPELEHPEVVVEGWRGDRVYLYRSAKAGRDSLSWVSTWESPEKAKQVAPLLERALARCMKQVHGEAGAGDYDLGVRVSGCDVVCGFTAEENAELVLRVTVEKTTPERRPPLGEEEEKE